MQRHTYKPAGVCATKIVLATDEGLVRHVEFTDGCSGNAQAIGRLVEGMRIDEVVRRLKGIDCDGKGTSCADQLVKALETAINSAGSAR
jgi:uncharacterized protein (TIGR03905 family)